MAGGVERGSRKGVGGLSGGDDYENEKKKKGGDRGNCGTEKWIKVTAQRQSRLKMKKETPLRKRNV